MTGRDTGASRRAFLAQVATGAMTAVVISRRAIAQQSAPQIHTAPILRDTQNLFAMDQSAWKGITRPPKPGIAPTMTADERDAFEHRIRCQCSCTLDVYTCRTTDFSCQVSPAMHRDVMALVKGGYSAQEIIDAFVSEYGQKVLMAPSKSGFNLLAWFAPATAVLIGAGAVAVVLRRWGTKRDPGAPQAAQPAIASVSASPGDATPDELARLEAAVRGDEGA